MTKPHKHAAVIKAWADGAEIQVARPVLPTMEDPMGQREPEWHDTTVPNFAEHMLCRVKPKATKVRLRVAVMSNSVAPEHAAKQESGGLWTLHVTTDKAAKSAEESGQFIQWLGDWVEVERPAPEPTPQQSTLREALDRLQAGRIEAAILQPWRPRPAWIGVDPAAGQDMTGIVHGFGVRIG